jgi:hypothetical protein
LAGDFPESRVVQIWQDCPGRSDLRTRESGPLQVLYPGRINDDSGADFRDAVIATSRGLQTGDIEVHAKSSLWWAHRHHLDPVYNRVVLHVVFRRDTTIPVRLQNGREVPTLALEELDASEAVNSCFTAPPVPCQGAGLRYGDVFLSEILDSAGDSRFLARAAVFQPASPDDEAGQALYTGIMAALGYSRNRYQMAELAVRMPLQRLESAARLSLTETDCLAIYEAFLKGAAGLLPCRSLRERDAPDGALWNTRLEKLWSACGDTAAMSVKDWRFFRIRPGNYPTLRIAAAARLLWRYREKGLLEGLAEKFESVPVEGGRRFLEDALIIDGKECSEIVNRFKGALLGRQRAADIVINVWLPFAAARGRSKERPDMAQKALNLYRRYPAIASNTLERHMCRQLGIARGTVKTARRQQGLLHLLKSFCAVGNCPGCPVYKALKGAR